MLCEYGCNQEAKYQLKNGKWCCSEHTSQCPAIKEKNSTGLKQAHEKGLLSTKQFDEDGCRNWAKNKNCLNDNRIKAKTNDINDYLNNKLLIRTSVLKKYLINLNILENKCSICGTSNWNDKEIELELHHLDGNNKNNNLNNLQLLCPNCHSQTKNYRGKNTNKYRNWLDNIIIENFIEQLENNKNIRKSIISYNNIYDTQLPIEGTFYNFIKHNIIEKYDVIIGKNYCKNSV